MRYFYQTKFKYSPTENIAKNNQNQTNLSKKKTLYNINTRKFTISTKHNFKHLNQTKYEIREALSRSRGISFITKI